MDVNKPMKKKNDKNTCFDVERFYYLNISFPYCSVRSDLCIDILLRLLFFIPSLVFDKFRTAVVLYVVFMFLLLSEKIIIVVLGV